MVSKFSPTTYRVTFETGQYVQVTPSKIHDMLGDIASKLVFAREVDFLFKVNFLTFYIYSCLEDSELPDKPTVQYLGPFTLLILLYLDSTKFDRFPVVRTRPAIRDWTSTLMRQRQDLETKHRVIGCLDLHDEWIEYESESHGIQLESHGILCESHEIQALFKRAEEKLAAICSERVFLEDLMRKASSDYPGDGKFVELQDKYVQVFRDPISFDVDMDVVNESNGDDDNDNDGDGNVDKEDLNGSNPSFGFSKISLDDFGNDSGPTEKESVNPAEQGIIVEGDTAEECQIMSTPENYTQWLDKNADLVGEGDLFGDDSATRELMNQGPVTPERTPTQKASPIHKKRVVKPSPYILSPYMNKKTNVVPKITRLEFILGNSVFAMQNVIQSESDEIQSESHVIHFESHVILSESHVILSESHVIQYLHDSLVFLYSENVFETHYEEYSVYGIHLNMETLAPGLWINANVIDCWGAILNHEERFRVADSKTRHFFPTGCITQSMFDGTLATDDAKWDSFSNQVKAQFSGNDDRLALQGIDLKKLFTRHLKEYGHDRHTKIAKLIPKIPKLKWRTKGNYQDCGIFTMLHMESYNAGAVANWDCGLVAEYGLQLDMLRRLRFKFATKILLHEINVHAQKMLDLAKEFDKLESDEKVSIIIHALKNRKERDRI
ncbi:ulp1 protease family, C-terminal catalytic domain-containing protein [Tanacetum coccineum]